MKAKHLSSFLWIVVFLTILSGGATAATLPHIDLLLLSESNPHEPEGVKAQTGSSIETVQKSIGSAGGEIVLTQGVTSGVKVIIPPGVFPGDINVALSRKSGAITPFEGVFSGAIIDIAPGTLTSFQSPIKISLPFNPANGLPVPYYINANGYLEPCQITSIDTATGVLTFESYHASLFTWIYSLISPPKQNLTGFKTGADGFQITNFGTAPLTIGGECFGMSAFSIWYYSNKGSGLYDKYYSKLNSCAGVNMTGQDIIATRAHLSVARQWDLYRSKVIEMANLTDLARLAWIRNALANTKIPIVLHLSVGESSHAVVAYDIDEKNSIYIYDPNAPNATRSIKFNTDTNTFEPYSGYTAICPLGTGTFFCKEAFENIWKDAENGFSSPDATIQISSHVAGSTVQDRNQTIVGKVTSGQAIVEKIEIYINGNIFYANVNSSGDFSLPLTLDPGFNTLKFTTKAYDTKNNLVAISNNMQCNQFSLNVPDDRAVILVTLTWDKNDTDLDLYAIDPTGDYSCYYHKPTADGGQLDYDIIFGYGPEHWTLQYLDTIRWNQDYRIRVHYFSDHGNGGTNYTVTIKLYEGTAQESFYTYSGYIVSYNTSNSAPTDTGPDWHDVVLIRPVQAGAGTSLTDSGSGDLNNLPVITVPVPSLSEREQAKETPPGH